LAAQYHFTCHCHRVSFGFSTTPNYYPRY